MVSPRCRGLKVHHLQQLLLTVALAVTMVFPRCRGLKATGEPHAGHFFILGDNGFPAM